MIPTKLAKLVLNELHSSHLGIVRMKAMARSYVWWQNIDRDIETRCEKCQATQSAPPVAPLQPWLWPLKPWK